MKLAVGHLHWTIIAIATVIAVCAGLLGLQVKTSMDGYIDKQLSEKGLNKAIEQATNGATKIAAIAADAELLSKKFQPFSERLVQINNQDNIVLKDDLKNLFVNQPITNTSSGRIVLDYEPIPHTVNFQTITPSPAIFAIYPYARLEGKKSYI
ncbi:MAG: hypothetical protein WDM76_07875 [Limisphaerales bacterium]